jgi:hypothetical protein
MAYLRNISSDSFLREELLAEPCIANQEDARIMSELFKRNEDMTLSLTKTNISKTLYSIGIDGRMVFNAPNLESIRDFNELRAELEYMRDYLSDTLGLRGVLEFHFGKDESGNIVDKFINSAHIHFWGDSKQDTAINREMIAEYIVNRGFSYHDIVMVQRIRSGKKVPIDELNEVLVETQVAKTLQGEVEEPPFFIVDENVLSLQRDMDMLLNKMNIEIEVDEDSDELSANYQTSDSLLSINKDILETQSRLLNEDDLVLRF